MARTSTLGDVAQAAGFSSATVSRYMNGSLRLPAETARRIDTAVAALDYRPNAHARNLSRGKSDTIGLLLPEIANPFFAQVASAVEAAADSRNLGVILCTSLNKPLREIDYLTRLQRSLVDGVLFATNHVDDGSLADVINLTPGVVLLDEDVEGTDVPKVFSDNYQGGHLAALHLLEHGHTTFAYAGGPRDLMSSRERGAGFCETIRASGHQMAIRCHGDYSRQHGQAAASAIFDGHTGVTAIFAGSDEILIGLLGVLRKRSLRAGADVSLVTFDDAGPLDLLDPPITAIRQQIDEIGRIALDCVLRGRNEDGQARIEKLPVSLVARSSVAPPRRAKSKQKKDQSA